jgi:hypothetical protein
MQVESGSWGHFDVKLAKHMQEGEIPGQIFNQIVKDFLTFIGI